MSNATHNDVLQFLESLDKLQTPTEETKTNNTSNTSTSGTTTAVDTTNVDAKPSATTTESVLQFLDEITNNTNSSPSAPAASAAAQTKPSAASAPAEQKQENKSSWNWGSFWNNAQNTVNQASQNLKKGMEAAQKNLEGNERLRGIASQFNKENIEKLGNDLKKMTVNVIDSIAPPISAFNPTNETTLWVQINENKDFAEQVNDVVKYVVEEMFSNSVVRRNVVKGKFLIQNEILPKEKQQPVSVGISAAVNTADDLFNEFLAAHPKREPKVQQIPAVASPNEKPESPNAEPKPVQEIVTSFYDMYLFLQPFYINLSRPNSEKTLTHTAYYVMFYYPNYEDPKKDIFISYTTQSVSCRDNMESKNDETNPLRSQIYEEWNDDRKLKVIEGGVWTVFEELLVRMKEYNYDTETIAGLTGQVL